MKKSTGRRLQRELQWRLMLPLLAIVALLGALGAYTAQYYVDRVFDRWLIDGANSLAEQVRFDGRHAVVRLSAQAEQMLTYDVVDRTYYQVIQDAQHVLGTPGLPQHGRREASYSGGARAFDATFSGREVRIVWVPVNGSVEPRTMVAMAETLIKRERAQLDLLLALVPVAVLAFGVAAWVIRVTVNRTLQPLEHIAGRWNERSHESLAPIASDDVPVELQPFALALNGLLARVRDMLERERQFAATVSHQLRTPLAGLQLGVARASAAPTLDAAREALGELGAATQRMARMVQQLLALSRLDPEIRGSLELTKVDLVAVAREVGEIYLDAAQRKGVEMELSCAETPVYVQAQPDLMREALGNLIENAVQYTPAGGHISIAVQAERAEITVADSGPGIPEGERATVLERFVRGRTASGEGSGLGLAIVREIAALHDAHVLVESGSAGGASVTLRFAWRVPTTPNESADAC